jgi:Calcium binding
MARPKKPKKPERDEIREDRILMEIVVDAHDEEERAMGWYYYLEDTLRFPFRTRCVQVRATSPLQVGDEVEVVGMAPADECMREMFVEITGKRKKTLAVPLSQLEVVEGDDGTRQAVEDWQYWMESGYEF